MATSDSVEKGSDFCTIYVRPTSATLATTDGKRPTHHDQRLADEIRFVKFSNIVWTADNKGFFYQVRLPLVYFILF
jgi:prolyl oligopeptidase